MDLKKPGAYVIGISSTNEEICAASGRISTGKGSALEILERSHDRDKNISLIDKVTRSGHTSTLEHCYYNLAFSNVSVVVEQFMIEFRLASFTVQSRRYVDFSDCGYHVPEFRNDEIKKKYCETMDYLFSEYAFLTENGIAKEDARFVLPYCFRSNFFCSLNARELINVLRSMIYGRGSKYDEIRNLGLSLYEECKNLTPGIFTDFEKKNSGFCDTADLSFIEEEPEPYISDKTCLIASTPEPAKTVARAALIEQGRFSPEQIERILSDNQTVTKILDSVIASARPRALESVQFSFRLSEISLACLTHFTRHRMQSIIIPDLNTCDRKKYVVPASLAGENLERYKKCFEKIEKLYNELSDMGAKKEDLIYCLLSGNTINVVSTMNARELLLFFRLRTCTRAQWEIQNHANDMLFALRGLCPELFRKYGPSCYLTGKCPEGRFSCGQAQKIKEKYSS